MTTIALVDPELLPMLASGPSEALSLDTLEQRRKGAGTLPPVPETATTLERVSVPGAAGAPDVLVHIFRPAHVTTPVGCIYHMHGGGFVMGRAGDLEYFHRPLVEALGCAIVSVEYRLAPETPFPGPIEDCYAGLAWTFANAERLGIDRARIGVMGESAGGGLAAALALLVRDRGEHTLAFQHLTYPMLDDRTCQDEPHPTAGEFVWDRASNRFGWTALLGYDPGTADVSIYAAPARATDLSGLPPTYLMTAALDLFVEENIHYARSLMAAGVPTELHVYPGAVHGFDFYLEASVASRAHQDRIAALSRALR